MGRIEPGLLADLVLVSAEAAGTIGAPSIDTLVQHAGPEHVRSMMVDGRWVMRDGQIIAFDEAAILSEASAYAERLRSAVAPQVASLRLAMPGLTARVRDSMRAQCEPEGRERSVGASTRATICPASPPYAPSVRRPGYRQASSCHTHRHPG